MKGTVLVMKGTVMHTKGTVLVIKGTVLHNHEGDSTPQGNSNARERGTVGHQVDSTA